ncbi:phosphoenolpyruvate--protein phosphotransferase [Zavarzinia sp. CC-PAN008]|uniref:phosphoenolpyruvate--protein phosphotransferase n=1 Tax=Zavarzinia sp. CC-PAN008 TaxID=3243332 RepID=UPI003F74A644
MTPGPATGPRVLLRRLRDVMAGPESPQARLDKTVRLIAANMVAEVCSIYLLRAGNVLELFATEGLNPEAVHQTKLKVGEGLVGTIAETERPLILPDAPSHPKFAYKPETGEEIYHSWLGVPIVRAGRVSGVLVVQNRTMREYDEEEVDALQTIAMVLAELVAQGGLVDPAEVEESDFQRRLAFRFDGKALAEGLASGLAVLHEPRIRVQRMIAEDAATEHARLARAVAGLRDWIDDTLAGHEAASAGETREILEAYRLFAHDRGWLNRIEEAIASGLTAEGAVERVQIETRARMGAIADPYLRERLDDLEELANRLLRHLVGRTGSSAHETLPEEAVVIARTMGAAELLDYDRSRLRAVVLEEGAPTAHVAIVARALGIPLVGRCEAILDSVEAADPVIVDGDMGQVFIRPTEQIAAAYAESLTLKAQAKAAYLAVRERPAISRDGVEVKLNINAGLLVDLPLIGEAGADGIGLFRTELQFMVSATLPHLAKQIELYSAVLDAAGGKPVIFRSLDIGSDKTLPYMPLEREENPALGLRAVRLTLDRVGLLRTQAQALLTAAAGRDLNVMFPMITDVHEFRAAKAVLETERARLIARGRPVPRSVRVGTMIEVPALAWQLPALLPLVDFVSIGSNDLLQFFFAVDRGHPRLAERYDILAPSVLGFLKRVVDLCNAAKVPVSLCGEMAGRPLTAMALLGLGLRSISLQPAAIGPVKMMILSLDVGALSRYMETLYGLPVRTLRGRLMNFAQDHGILV